MTLSTARLLNQAACHVGAHVMGITHPALRADMLEIVQRCTLAQLETATDIVDALNLRPEPNGCGHTGVCTCEYRLLKQVKDWADRQPHHSP